MDEQIKALTERLQAIHAEIRKLTDKPAAEWTPEDHEAFDKADADFQATKAHRDRLYRARQIQSEMEAAPANTPRPGLGDGGGNDNPQPAGTFAERMATRMVAAHGWMLHTADRTRRLVTDDHRAAMAAMDVQPQDREISIPLMGTEMLTRFLTDRRLTLRSRLGEMRMTTTAGAGGETIPEGFLAQLEISMLAFGGMRQVATIIRTTTGNDLPLPTVNDTGNTGELMTEASAAATQDVATSAIVFQAFKYGSKVIKISYELMQDSAFNLMAELGRIGGMRIGRLQSAHFTTGTGSGQPKGVTVGAGVGVTAASPTAIAADELIDLIHSVDPAYRPVASFMLADATAAIIRKLKDGNNQYLWMDGLQAGQPDRLLGYPVTINQQMPAATTGLKSVAFGDMSKYVIRDAGEVRLRRTDDRYWEEDNVGFMVVQRSDGDLVDAGTDPVKVLQQA